MIKYKKYLFSLILSSLVLFVHYNVYADATLVVMRGGGSQTQSFTDYVDGEGSCSDTSTVTCSASYETQKTCPKTSNPALQNSPCSIVAGSCFGLGCASLKPKIKYKNSYQFGFKQCKQNGPTTFQTANGNISVYSWNEWSEISVTVIKNNNTELPTKENVAASECKAYGTPTKIASGWLYTTMYSRCCTTPSPAQSDVQPSCYRRKTTSSTDTNYTKAYEWGILGIGNLSNINEWTIVEGIDSKEECQPQPTFCEAKNDFSKPIESETTKCKEKVSVNPTQTSQCKESNDTFYTVNCNHTVDTDFNPQKFTDIIYLKAGQGFGFNINVEHKVVCTGKFYATNYMNSYNAANALIFRASQLQDGEEKAKELKWAENIREKISMIATNYLNYYSIVENEHCSSDPVCMDKLKEYSFNYSGSLKYKYINKNGNQNYSGTFILNNSLDTGFELINKEKSNQKEIYINGQKKYIHNFNYTAKESTILIPQSVVFDYYGNIITNPSATTTTYPGGNKFYTDLYINPGKYDMSIELEVTKNSQKVATINNKKCDLGIYDDKLNYRIIDVTNPFVNNVRTIGMNWLNNTHDFTNTIKSDIWSKKPLYTFNIPKEKITDIKKSNANDSDSYLGTCNKSQNQIDTVMKDICTEINSK